MTTSKHQKEFKEIVHNIARDTHIKYIHQLKTYEQWENRSRDNFSYMFKSKQTRRAFFKENAEYAEWIIFGDEGRFIKGDFPRDFPNGLDGFVRNFISNQKVQECPICFEDMKSEKAEYCLNCKQCIGCHECMLKINGQCPTCRYDLTSVVPDSQNIKQHLTIGGKLIQITGTKAFIDSNREQINRYINSPSQFIDEISLKERKKFLQNNKWLEEFETSEIPILSPLLKDLSPLDKTDWLLENGFYKDKKVIITM